MLEFMCKKHDLGFHGVMNKKSFWKTFSSLPSVSCISSFGSLQCHETLDLASSLEAAPGLVESSPGSGALPACRLDSGWGGGQRSPPPFPLSADFAISRSS